MKRAYRVVAALVAMTASVGQAGAPVAPPGAAPVVLAEFIDEHPPYPQAHASTIVELPDGCLAAAWFGGTGERNGDVDIWFSSASMVGRGSVPAGPGTLPVGRVDTPTAMPKAQAISGALWNAGIGASTSV